MGLAEKETEDMLHGTQFIQEVKDDIRMAEDMDMNYVPFYRFNKTQIVEGSIEVADYLELLDKAYAGWTAGHKSSVEEPGQPIQGKSCRIDGVCS